jgi:Fe-S-cluster containining protein
MNCENCGACCRILPIAINSITAEEKKLINTRKDAWVDVIDGVMYIVLQSDCRYLKDYKCSIYDRRPDYCKKFEVGGKDCLLARKIEAIE